VIPLLHVHCVLREAARNSCEEITEQRDENHAGAISQLAFVAVISTTPQKGKDGVVGA
jgi:hypothetical protein